MALSPSDAYRAAAAPLTASATLRLFEITDSPASITLPTGLYEIRPRHDDTIPAMIRSGAAPTIPSPGPEVGVVIFPGDVVTFWHDASEGDGALHARLSATGSGALFIASKGAA